MKIEIEIKDIDNMRYPTVGDYYEKEDGTLKFEVADTGNPFYNKMVLIHEMIEQAMTEYLGITEQSIMDFDLQYEKEREEGKHEDDEEPGFEPDAPYQREHTIATAVEMMMCAHVGIAWNTYDDHIMNM
jgi:hypothetical protein